MNKREFFNVLGVAAAAGFGLARSAQAREASPYDLRPPFRRADSVSLLHMTDCHAQLLPMYFREPSVNLGVGSQRGQVPYLVSNALLRHARISAGSPEAYAHTPIDFERAADRYGKVGGFAHLAALVKRLKAARPGALLLDGGDSWQGSATALWTRGQDMVDAARLLGVDMMTGHWEFTLGAPRVKEIVDKDFAAAGIDFLAHNVRGANSSGEVFKPYAMRTINGHPVAVIGQAFPFTAIDHPRYFTPGWSFGIRELELQKLVDRVRSSGAHAVVLLSHNGMGVDLKLASRVTGIDAILGGHTHDGVPKPVIVKRGAWRTVVTNAGCNGKFVGVLDLRIRGKRVADFRYTLLPVFSQLLVPDREMSALIARLREPHEAQLREVLATTSGVLYRRGNFNGSWDQLILDALMATQDAPIALSPGFRWGATLLAGAQITREQLMEQTATTYSYATLDDLRGAQLKSLLEDAADTVFNDDPYQQHGGDMLRAGGLTYAIEPTAAKGARITDLRLKGVPIDADKRYKVAAWAPLSEGARTAGLKPVWELVEGWLRDTRSVAPRQLDSPRLIGVQGNPGLA